MDNSEAAKCPLCGADNQCAVAAGESPQSCWCQSNRIAPEALAALPETERGLRCLCPACARGPEGVEH